MSTRTKANELANEFLKEPLGPNQTQPTPKKFSFKVVDSQGKETGETVEVSVSVKSANLRKSIALSRTASLNEVSFFSPGSPCPTCRGSGSV